MAFVNRQIVFGTGVLALAMAAATSPAQIPGATGDKRLEAERLAGADTTTFYRLRDGATEYNPSEHKVVLEKAARWYVNRLTWIEHQQRTPETPANTPSLNDLVQEAFRYLPEPRRFNPKEKERANQKKYLAEYGKALVVCINEVLKNPMAVARVNAARILARLGECGVEDVSDDMVAVVNDKDQIDAVKLYALRGLRDLFETNGGRLKDPGRESRCVLALIEFLRRPPTYAKGAPPDEVDGFRYVRREAVQALGQYRQVALLDAKDKKKVLALPSLELLRVVSKSGLDPEPTLGEQTEAAIGVCSMSSKAVPTYQPDYAVYHVAYLVVDFVSKHAEERTRAGTSRTEPWRVLAVRLDTALEAMKADRPENKYLAEVVGRCLPLVRSVMDDKAVSAVQVRDWLGSNPPPSKELFKGDEKTTVSPPKPSDM